MSVELTIFRTGGVRIVRSAFMPWLPSPERDELVECPVWCALLRTSEGLVLFDTGLHPVHVERPEATFGANPNMVVTMRAEDAILARLAALDVKADDVDDRLEDVSEVELHEARSTPVGRRGTCRASPAAASLSRG